MQAMDEMSVDGWIGWMLSFCAKCALVPRCQGAKDLKQLFPAELMLPH